MNFNAIEDLFERLSAGDVAGAEEMFWECEPYLRKLARRRLSPRLRAKLDSTDVAHSVWADLFSGFREQRWDFPDAQHLRAFLVTVITNRVNDRFRRYQQSVEREQPLDIPGASGTESDDPTPSKVAEADDLWQRMLDLSPPEHHQLLKLKREGYSTAEIAERTGLHEGSVRRIVRQLAQKLAAENATIAGGEN